MGVFTIIKAFGPTKFEKRPLLAGKRLQLASALSSNTVDRDCQQAGHVLPKLGSTIPGIRSSSIDQLRQAVDDLTEGLLPTLSGPFRGGTLSNSSMATNTGDLFRPRRKIVQSSPESA